MELKAEDPPVVRKMLKIIIKMANAVETKP
jgi:hypothetical protein